MNEPRLVEGLSADRMKEARKRVRTAFRYGQRPTIDDIAQARGLVVAERENSIFSDAWMPLAILLVVVGFFIFERDVACMSLGFMLITIVMVGRWWRDRALEGVTYVREFDHTHVFPGEPIRMRLTVANQKRLPLTWLQFRDMIDGPLRVTSAYRPPLDSLERMGFVAGFALRGFESQHRDITLTFPHRGFYQVGPLTTQAGDLFTLFTVEHDVEYTDTLVVYPQVWPLTELGLPAKEPLGDLKVRRSLFTDPIKTLGIRDYHPTDRFRDIHWKATARKGDLQTKVYDPSTGMTAVVFLNIATAVKYWHGHEPELLERLVAVAASIANYGAEQGWSHGIYANGSVPRSDQPIRVRPGRSPNQLMHVLEALAAVTGYATGPIERLLQRESTRLPWAATLVLVTAIVTPEIVVTLNFLRQAGRRIVVISLGEEPPTGLGRIVVYHIPSSAPAFQPHRVADGATAAALQAVSIAQVEAFETR